MRDRPLSSLRVTVLLEAFVHSSAAPGSASRVHLSWGLVPFSARHSEVPGFPEGFHTLGTVRPQGFSTLSTAYVTSKPAGLVSSPLRSWGSRGPASLAIPFQGEQGGAAHGPSPRLSPPPRRARVGGPSSPALRRPSNHSKRLPISYDSGDGCFRVSIAEESVCFPVANRKHRPS